MVDATLQRFAATGRIRDVLYELFRNIVALSKIFGGVVGNPEFGSCVLPSPSFLRQIDGKSGRRHHQGRASFWTSENDGLGREHFHANLFRLPTVIDARKDGETLRL